MKPHSRWHLIRYCLVIATGAFVLNWIWEMLQMRAYADFAGQPWTDTVGRCTKATVGDVGITFAIYLIGALAAKDWWWAVRHPLNAYLTGSILGFLAATVIEDVAIETGRWSYGESMPLIPLLNAGLWPLMQLTCLIPISWWMANRFYHSSIRQNDGGASP